jgi:hypothetical protein
MGSGELFQDWPQTMILLISASQAARLAGMNHRLSNLLSTLLCKFCLPFLLWVLSGSEGMQTEHVVLGEKVSILL